VEILTRSVFAPIEIDENDISSVFQTMEEYRTTAQYASDYGFFNKTASAVKIHHQTYANLRKNTKLPSQLICASRNKASEVLKSLKEKKKKSQPHFKYFLPIRYDKRSSTIFEEKHQVSLATVNGRILVNYSIPDYFRKYDDWERRGIELIYRDKVFYLNFVVQKKVPKTKVHCGEVIGVDRGIKNIAVDSKNNFYNGKHVRELGRKYFRHKRSLQKKGTRSAKRRLGIVKGRERRFQKDVNHCVSEKLVGKSRKNSTIVFEDLSGIRDDMKASKRTNRELHSWPFFQLETFVKYKMKEKGMIFKEIDPRYTSQKCSQCGYISKGNRNGSQFKCRRCGYRSDADRNAAINIKQEYIDYSIQLFVETETPLSFSIEKRQNLAEEGISIFSGAQISSPIVGPIVAS
ncbi:MAG: RNA-guided endonuclease InsQ/TnpB family protein, partial [Candidatus Kariarchaeaceae archaeon]|jgi:IS605 OrfB family transposase